MILLKKYINVKLIDDSISIDMYTSLTINYKILFLKINILNLLSVIYSLTLELFGFLKRLQEFFSILLIHSLLKVKS